jgi:hypothetical protein
VLDSDALITRGAEAEQAREYINSIVSGAKELILDRLISLAPDQTLLFTIYRAQMLCLDDISTVVEADISAGRSAILTAQGEYHTQNGIL